MSFFKYRAAYYIQTACIRRPGFVNRMWHTLQSVIMNHSSNMKQSLALRHDVIQFSTSMVNSVWYMSAFIWSWIKNKRLAFKLKVCALGTVALVLEEKKNTVFEHVLCRTWEGKWRLFHLIDNRPLQKQLSGCVVTLHGRKGAELHAWSERSIKWRRANTTWRWPFIFSALIHKRPLICAHTKLLRGLNGGGKKKTGLKDKWLSIVCF